jgi:hypothetical protein
MVQNPHHPQLRGGANRPILARLWEISGRKHLNTRR